MPVRLKVQTSAVVRPAIERWRCGQADGEDVRLLVKHFLAVLAARAPGQAVEVRVPPFAAAQVIGGTTHKRGTPPAVVELDGQTWIRLALGDLAWSEARDAGTVTASGERSDLSAYLPL